MRLTETELTAMDPSRVCIIKPSALGDVVHALPVLAALRDRWPTAQISWVVNRGLRGLLDGHPDLNEVIPFDRPRLREAGRFLGFLRGLRSRRFDLVLDLQGLFRSGLMTWATGARVRIGRADAREGARFFYTHAVGSEASHAVDRLLALASVVGADISQPRFVPVIGDDAQEWAQVRLGGLPRPIVTFNLGARWITKRWPPESFAEVARMVHSRHGGSIVAVGAAEDRPAVDLFAGRLADLRIDLVDLCGKTRLPELAALAARSDLFVSNDTGPLHLAAATGTKTLGVFLCTDPSKTGAYGPQSATVASRIWCAASCLKTCPRLECMGELTAERVYGALEAALRGPHRTRLESTIRRKKPE